MVARRAVVCWLVQALVGSAMFVTDAISNPSSGPRTWPLVHIPDPVARRVTIQALEAAFERLDSEQCRQILTDFPEQDHLLTDTLFVLAVDIRTYLTMLVFIDDSRNRYCVSGVIAFTVPGSRVVRVCVDELKATWTRNPEHTIASFIHEVLHTLGLGENPPSSSTDHRARAVAMRAISNEVVKNL